MEKRRTEKPARPAVTPRQLSETTKNGLPQIRTVGREEGRALLDKCARAELRISGDAFVRRWDAGKYAKDDRPEVLRVAMLLPFAR